MMDKKHCLGCEQDFYNGKNQLGVPECWLLRTAKLASRRRVRMDEVPPWTAKPERLPQCYRQRGYIFVEPTVTR